jgi:hypothetical protein
LTQFRLEPREVPVDGLGAKPGIKEGETVALPPVFAPRPRIGLGRLVRGLGRRVVRLIR